MAKGGIKFVSIKAVIAKIIQDIGEWREIDYQFAIQKIIEVMSVINTAQTMSINSEYFFIENHQVMLPCNHIKTIMVEHNNQRVRFGNFKADPESFYKNKKTNEKDLEVVFQSEIEVVLVKDEFGNVKRKRFDSSMFYNNLRPVYLNPSIDKSYYSVVEGNEEKLVFTFTDQWVAVHYLSVMLDDEGYPMIPDIPMLHEAMYYYVLMKMIGRGFKHPVFKGLQGIQYLTKEYRQKLALSKASINMPSVEQMESMKNKLVQLMPSNTSWIQKDIGSEQDRERQFPSELLYKTIKVSA